MDSNDDPFEDDGGAFENPSEGPTDDLPTDADSLFSLVRDLTADILELEWEAAVYSRIASGRLHRTYVHRAQAAKALGVPSANDDIEAGRRQFAEGFTTDEARRIFLSGTELERDNLVMKSELMSLRWLAAGAPKDKGPLIRPACVFMPAR